MPSSGIYYMNLGVTTCPVLTHAITQPTAFRACMWLVLSIRH